MAKADQKSQAWGQPGIEAEILRGAKEETIMTKRYHRTIHRLGDSRGRQEFRITYTMEVECGEPTEQMMEAFDSIAVRLRSLGVLQVHYDLESDLKDPWIYVPKPPQASSSPEPTP